MQAETQQFQEWLSNPNFAIAVAAFLLISINTFIFILFGWLRGQLIRKIADLEFKINELVNATTESNAVNKTGIDLMVELYKNGKSNGKQN